MVYVLILRKIFIRSSLCLLMFVTVVNISYCTLRKVHYRYRKGKEAYRMYLTVAKEGVNISEGELLDLDIFISPLLLKGQSVHHIGINNPNEFNISEKPIYRYVSGGLLKPKTLICLVFAS